jgi:hypothetical protein
LRRDLRQRKATPTAPGRDRGWCAIQLVKGRSVWCVRRGGVAVAYVAEPYERLAEIALIDGRPPDAECRVQPMHMKNGEACYGPEIPWPKEAA